MSLMDDMRDDPALLHLYDAQRVAAVLLAAEELAGAFESSGNVTDRHARACHALVAYRAAKEAAQ